MNDCTCPSSMRERDAVIWIVSQRQLDFIIICTSSSTKCPRGGAIAMVALVVTLSLSTRALDGGVESHFFIILVVAHGALR
jgi:hypothetical protein